MIIYNTRPNNLEFCQKIIIGMCRNTTDKNECEYYEAASL